MMLASTLQTSSGADALKTMRSLYRPRGSVWNVRTTRPLMKLRMCAFAANPAISGFRTQTLVSSRAKKGCTTHRLTNNVYFAPTTLWASLDIRARADLASLLTKPRTSAL